MTDQDTQPITGQDEQQAQEAKTWPEISFDELSEKLKEACGRAGWEKLMPVQARSMAAVMERQDVMVQARTGSGKTGAFVLPLIERIDPEQNHCQALVLLPTRELAKQVAEEAKTLSGGTVRTVPVYGGVGYGPQIDAFKKGAHLVVGTPGRILDHLMRGSLDIDKLDTLVFDEADRMLSIGFYPDMKQLQSYLPDRDINGLMFSATFPPMVLRLSEEFLDQPQFITLSEDRMHVAEVSHQFCQVPPMGKERVLAKLIEVENPDSAIIFTNTKANCNFVAAVLKQFGYNADALSSDLSQSKREKVLDRVRSGKLKFLVATDVAARGIDIPELSHVFLYEPPEDRESYIHRSGRTGRAGAAGVVISLVDLMQKMELKRIATHYKIPLLERETPEDADIRSVVGQRTTALLEARHRKVSDDERTRYELFLPMVDELAGRDDTIGHLAMLLDEYYHASVHDGGAPVPNMTEEMLAHTDIDMDRLAGSLDREYGSMKPLSRERMMKFMLLARELSGDDDGKPLLAMLLDAYYFVTVYRTPKPQKTDKPKAAKAKVEKPKKERKPAKEVAPKQEEAPATAEEEASQPLEKQGSPQEKPEREEAPAHAEQEAMDVLGRLRGMRPLEQDRLDSLLPLAEELTGSDDALTAIAVLLDRFERESRRIDARKAKRKKNGRKPRQEQDAQPQDMQPQREAKARKQHKPEVQPESQQPKPEPEQEYEYTGPAHGLQANLWDDDDEPEQTAPEPRRKKRPRRRRRKR